MHTDLSTFAVSRAFVFIEHHLFFADWISGLWHHLQRRLQPFIKTVVRIPKPSAKELLCISNIIAFFIYNIPFIIYRDDSSLFLCMRGMSSQSHGLFCQFPKIQDRLPPQ